MKEWKICLKSYFNRKFASSASASAREKGQTRVRFQATFNFLFFSLSFRPIVYPFAHCAFYTFTLILLDEDGTWSEYKPPIAVQTRGQWTMVFVMGHWLLIS